MSLMYRIPHYRYLYIIAATKWGFSALWCLAACEFLKFYRCHDFHAVARDHSTVCTQVNIYTILLRIVAVTFALVLLKVWCVWLSNYNCMGRDMPV